MPFHLKYLIEKLFLGGKRDEKLILPINDSISATLDTEHVGVTQHFFLISQFFVITFFNVS